MDCDSAAVLACALAKIAMQEDTPGDKVGSTFIDLAFKGNPLGRDIAGTKTTVKSITKKLSWKILNLEREKGCKSKNLGNFTNSRHRI